MTSTLTGGIDNVIELPWKHIQDVLEHYERLGPLGGIAVPMIEAFVPLLPLVAILIANVNAYGFWEGLLYSWIGVVAGSVSVFFIARRFGGWFRTRLEKRARPRTFIQWLEKRGFTLIFVLACFPFTPSSLVNLAAGISKLPFHTFFTATLLGKGVMIAVVSLAGYDLGNLLKQPWKLLVITTILITMWLAGRKLESRYMK